MKLHYSYTKGKGIPILFLHGNSLNNSIFYGIQESVQKNHSIYLVDLPGHGQSPAMDEYCFSGLIKAVCYFLNSTIEEPFVVVAHSLSGHIILQCLVELKLISGLLLVGTPPLSTINDMAFAFNDLPSWLLFKQKWSVKELDDLSEILSKGNQSLIKAALRCCDSKFKADFLKADFIDVFQNELEIIKNSVVPVAITWSVDDPFLNQEYFDRIELLSDRSIHIHKYERGGHMPFIDEQNLFLQCLNQFILHLN